MEVCLLGRIIGRLCGAILLLAVAVPAGATQPIYKLTASVPLGIPDRWDYVVFDPSTQRIYVAHQDAVTVVNAATLTIAGHLAGLDGAHGTAPVPALGPALGKVFADSGKTGTVTDYDATTFAPHATIKAVGDADGMIYDPASGQVVVVGGDSAAAGFIDPRTDRLTATLALGGSPEGVAVDGRGKMFIALADHDEVAAVDTRARRILARWKLSGCHDPHGLAMDPASNRLFVSCPAGQMAVVDAASGHQTALFPIGKGSDSAAFDPSHHVALSGDGDGTIGIVAETKDGVHSRGTVSTQPGARTLAVDPATGRVFAVTATVAGSVPPKVAGGRARLTFIAGTLRLLVYTPESPAP